MNGKRLSATIVCCLLGLRPQDRLVQIPVGGFEVQSNTGAICPVSMLSGGIAKPDRRSGSTHVVLRWRAVSFGGGDGGSTGGSGLGAGK